MNPKNPPMMTKNIVDLIKLEKNRLLDPDAAKFDSEIPFPLAFSYWKVARISMVPDNWLGEFQRDIIETAAPPVP
jgi:hypothetical protein